MSHKINKLKLIEEIKKRNILWDSSNINYKDENKTKKSWFEVCCQLVNNFMDLSEEARNEILNATKSEWMSIRNKYYSSKQEMTTTYSALIKNELLTMREELNFLDPVPPTKSMSDNLEHLKPKSKEVDETIKELPTSKPSSSHEPKISPSLVSLIESMPHTLEHSNPESKTIDDTIMEASSSKPSSSFEQEESPSLIAKAKRESDSTVLTSQKYSTKEYNPELAEENIEFFNSLLPSLKFLTPYNKLTFRIETMRCLYKLIRKQYGTESQNFNDELLPENS
ncbi:hypothetical protein M0802_009990 [Mischocyttarus mexicanus]|nr:hypothetical protein M0802_009990 [Mischocyttarus mexicanus]